MEKQICCLCGKEIKDEYGGHNPYPLKNRLKDGGCCDICNSKLVIPARLKQFEEPMHREIAIDNSKPIKEVLDDLLKRGINEKVKFEDKKK